MARINTLGAAGLSARVAAAVATIACGGIATLVTASAHHVVSSTPLCAAADHPAALAPCVSSPNVVDSTLLFDSAYVDASADRYVKFILWAPGTCGVAGQPEKAHVTVPVGGGAGLHTATLQTQAWIMATSVGTYEWTTEVLRHDMSIEWGPTACGTELADVVKATPALSIPPAQSVLVGSPLADQATLAGGDSPSGDVTFQLFAPGDAVCIGTPLRTFSSTPLVAGSAATANVTATEVGVYHWIATYSGDDHNHGVSTSCASHPVTVSPAQPAVGTTPSAGGAVGTGVSDAATVTGGFAPAGSVRFALYGPADTSCSGTPVFTETESLPAGSATVHSATFMPAMAGTYRWTAQFTSSDPNNSDAAGRCGDELVVITAAPVQGDQPAPAPQQPVESGVQAATSAPVPDTGAGTGPSGALTLLLAGAALSAATVIRNARRMG